MALNVKGAMLVCMACISAGTWLIHTVQVRDVPVTTPVIAAEPGVADTSSMVASGLPLENGRATWVQQFGTPSAFDRQATLNKSQGPVAMAPAALDRQPVELPPLVLPNPSTAVAAEMVVASGPLPASTVPVGMEVLEPVGRKVAVADAPADPVEAPPVEVASRAHRVARGETLAKIAERYYGARDARLQALILSENKAAKGRGGKILAGEVLRIPALPDAPAVAAGAPATEPAGWYTIQPKDSLSSIAGRFLDDPGRWREIVAVNERLDPKKIIPGMRIKLPPGVLATR